MKRALPLTALTISGIVMVANFFFKYKPLNNVGSGLSAWGVIIAAFALGLGAVNLVQVQVRNIRSGKNTLNGIVAIVGMLVMAAVGIATGQKGSFYTFLFANILQPLGDTVFSLLAFYIASASYRAFRARSAETWILLAAAAILILGNTPFIGLISGKIPVVANWFLNNPTVAARRAITVSASIGALAAAIRAFAGLDARVTG
jgi:hypothetical protein